MSYTGRQIYTVPADTWALDAFGRGRVSNSHILLSSSMLYDSAPLIWADVTAGTGSVGAHAPDRASVTLTAAGVAGDVAMRQTRAYFAYKPGQSQLVACSFVAEAADNVAIVRRLKVSGSVVDTRVEQAAWSIDPLDGTGPSGVVVDWSKSQILLLDLQWLGVGRVRAALDIDGAVVPFHDFNHANVLESVYMSRATLPVRYEVRNVGALSYRRVGYFDADNGIFLELRDDSATSVSIEQVCSSVVREGGDEEPGAANAAHTSTAGPVRLQSDSDLSMLALRLKATYPHATTRRLAIKLLNEDANSVHWHALLVRGSDLPAGFSAWTDAGNATCPSAVEYSVDQEDASSLFGVGRVVGMGYLPAGDRSNETVVQADLSDLLTLSTDAAGSRDVLILCGRVLGGTGAADCYASMLWREVL